MAKTESTAVNDLIALVNQPPLHSTPSEELQFDERQRPAPTASMRPPASRVANSASMTPTSATLAPLPRSRAPHGTASNLVPPRRSTALPPPRPSAQMAVPHISAIIAEPAVAPVAARVAWPFASVDGPRTEPIEQIELSLDDDNVDDIDAIAFDDDEIAFDGDPNAPVPTSVMAQNDIDRLADQSTRAVADVARLDEGWTPNSSAPLTLDDNDGDFAISETSPFLNDKNQAVAAALEVAAPQTLSAQLPRAASAPVLAMAPLPRPRATSPVPVHARPSAVHGVPQLPPQLQTAHLNPASLPQLPRASGINWPTDFGPTVSPSEVAVVEVRQPHRVVDVAPPKANRTATQPNKIAAALPLAAGLAVVGLFAGGYLYFNNQKAEPVVASPVAGPTTAAASPTAAVVEAAPEPVLPIAATQPITAAMPATELGAATAPIATEPATPATTNPAAVEPAAIAVAAATTEAAPTDALTNIPTTTERAIAIPGPLPTVPQPAVAGALATPGDASLVNVRFESKPPGATVTLVDRGRTALIGTTPISAALDSTHNYEIVFSLDGRATQIAKLDPKKSRTIKSILPVAGSRQSSSKADTNAAVAVAAVAGNQPGNKPANKPAAEAITQPRVSTKPAMPVRATAANEIAAVFGPASQAGSGIVMISSKPPCEIVIDGKATGLMTPQRNLTMTAGPHTVTLLNKPNGIKKVLSVQVTAGKSTKLVQDYTALIKN